ncbi:I78 family peptidase inhibitor [Brucella tritici]|uniref:I78 family peptidase inhibitor n=1 Tax=Brucella tritici TaxID=94626 RepID=UPI002000A09D|nr:I78 family peptidase inhibitor [Brucella tritici]
MTEIWVYKADGTIQCVPASETEISLAEMRKQLETLIGENNVLSEEKWPPAGPAPAVCGLPTGNRNAYKITPDGLQLLFSGVAGPSGFEVDPRTKIMIDPNDAITPWPLGGPADPPVIPWPTKMHELSDNRPVPWPWVAIASSNAESGPRTLMNVLSSLNQVGSHPTMISELLGRVARVYNEGDMVTFDYLPHRVNIVLDRGQISRIWFG